MKTLERPNSYYKMMRLSEIKPYGEEISDSLLIDRIITDVCYVLDVKRERLNEPCRLATYSSARKVICYVLRTKMNLTYHHIGRILNRDHSTALYSCKWMSERIDSLKFYPDECKTLEYVLKGF